jgi:hypothetical protein
MLSCPLFPSVDCLSPSSAHPVFAARVYAAQSLAAAALARISQPAAQAVRACVPVRLMAQGSVSMVRPHVMAFRIATLVQTASSAVSVWSARAVKETSASRPTFAVQTRGVRVGTGQQHRRGVRQQRGLGERLGRRPSCCELVVEGRT